MKSKNNIVVSGLKIVSLIPLIIYPFIVFANLMSLAGHRTGNESFSLILSSYAFLIFSLMYPLTLTLTYSLIFNRDKKIFIAFLPIIHLIISVLLYILWMNAK